MLSIFRILARRGWTVLLASVCLLLLFFGCTSTVSPPPSVQHPLAVYLVQDARHMGLALPDPSGSFEEYGYGDWDWYALMHNSWYHAFDTVLWPTRGCLGRKTLDPGYLAAQVRAGTAWALRVEKTRVRELLTRLENRFDGRLETQLFNPTYGVHFVEDEDSFWFPHMCHDAVAGWLEDLDCEVSWAPIRLGLTVKKP